MKRVVFKIRGMDCAEEVAMLKKAIRPLVGDETHLAFDLLNGTMTVQLPDDTCPQETIQHAVAHTGMTAIPLDHTQSQDHEGDTFWERRGRTLLCIISGCALAGGVVWHAWHHGRFLGAFTAGYASAGHPSLESGCAQPLVLRDVPCHFNFAKDSIHYRIGGKAHPL